MKKIKLLIPLLGFTSLATIGMPLTSCGGTGGGGGESTGGVKEITTDTTLTSGSFSSTKSDQNAVLVNGKITANLSNITLNKTGDGSDMDNCNFKGVNSALLAKGGSTVVLDKMNVTTNAAGANGVFAYGGNEDTKSTTSDGTNITISNSTINTSKDSSGGIMVAGHGKLTASNCTVTTQGDSSAAIRSDRGGNSMTVTGGTYTSNGTGSPAIYSTATINVSGATLKSNHSEGVIVEGSNFVTLTNCNLEDTNDELNPQAKKDGVYKNIFLYQSTSGDAGSGGDGITINGGTIKTHNGDDFYVTNQTSEIVLNGVTIENDYSGTKYFLRAKGNSVGWGESGKNGGKVTLKANNQTMDGDIYVDNISTVAMTMTGTSSYNGTVNAAKNTAGCTLSLASTSTMNLTGNCYFTSFTNADSTNSNITTHGYGIYVYSGGKWVQKV